MKPNNQPIINCPNCKAEYLLCEIFYPDFLGKPESIIKDKTTGKLIHVIADGYNPDETYTCDNCGHTFKVHLNIEPVAEKDELHSFEVEHTTKI